MLRSKPSLPSWLSFQVVKKRNHGHNGNTGYLYGTPPKDYTNKKFEIEIVGLNQKTYETRVAIISFKVISKPKPINRIELKVANMNWYDVIESVEGNDLRKVISVHLWPESSKDLSVTFMQSAIKMGSRYGFKPNSHEGVVIIFGSNAELSQSLIDLNEEIKPLTKLSTCTYKKTKVQSYFVTSKNNKFIVDWCAVKIFDENEQSPSAETEIEEASFISQQVWNAPTKGELPERNYSEEIAISIAVPSVILALFVAMLTIVLCFQHEKL